MSNNQLTLHPTWNVLDNTKVTEFMRCPRRFFFRYVLGWQPEEKRNDLYFGECVHKAMAVLLSRMPYQNIDDRVEVVRLAYNTFEQAYRERYPLDTDELHEPKTPRSVMMMLSEYVGLYVNDNFVVKHIEVAGTASVGHKFPIRWRLDGIVEDDRGIYGIEHKTASRLTQGWIDKFTQSNQVDTYTHVLNCFYPNDRIFGVVINGLIFNKTQRQFQRVPIRKTPLDMESWLWHINFWFDRIEEEYEALADVSEDEPVMTAFPKQTEACSDFFGCPYLSICSSWHNPLREVAQGPPIGFDVRFWDPRDRELDAKEIVNFTEKEDKDAS